MRKLVLLFGFLMLVGGLFSQSHKITVKLKNYKDSVMYLANYYGDKQYIVDTAFVKNGVAVFQDKKPLDGGIYLVVMKNKKYFEVVIDKEQEFSIEADTVDFVKTMKFKGCNDNVIFYEYLNYLNIKHKEIEPLRKLYPTITKSNKDSIDLVTAKIKAINDDVEKFIADFKAKNPNHLFTKVLRANEQINVPDAPILPNGKKDSTFQYRYFKQHFFDNIDFNDDRILRSPIYHEKISYYMTKLILQLPDTIIKEADWLIEKTKNSKELFKYTVWFITNHYETSNYMGMDAIFVHMAEKYYMTGKAFWVNDTQLEKIKKRALATKPLLIGKVAPNIVMQDTLGKDIALHSIKAKYTVLFVWDPDCGHCQKETPVLRDFYKANKDKYNLEIFAAYAEYDPIAWKRYIVKNNLIWLNVSDFQHRSFFKNHYDINATPVIYVLDKDKKIVAKKIGAAQLGDVLEQLEKMNKK